MAVFDSALPFTLGFEGGWSDDPADPGGATMNGITLAVAQSHGIPDKEALRCITPEKVAEIYRSGYWRYDGVVDQRVATKIFDIGVNMGVRTAVWLTQGALNDLGATLKEDGSFGPATLAAVNAAEPRSLLDRLCLVSADHYKGIVAHRPESGKFLKGWLHRATEVPSV